MYFLKVLLAISLPLAHCNKYITPAVYEELDDIPLGTVRVTRNGRGIEYAQQDMQLNRYKQQQETDSYIRAYHAAKKQTKQYATTVKQDYPVTKNVQPSRKPKPQVKQTITHKDIPKEAWVSVKQVQKTVSTTPLPLKKKKEDDYKVHEIFEDQEVASSKNPRSILRPRVGRGYYNPQYPLVLSPNYLANPEQTTVNSRLPAHEIHNFVLSGSQHLADPHANYFDGSQDYHTLNSLIGKTPTLQLEGLHALIGSQENKAPEYYAAANENTYNTQLIKEYTPITEEVADVANAAKKPNVRVAQDAPKVDLIVHNTKFEKIAGYGHDEHAQYAAKYAFGYRVRDHESGNDFGHEESRDGNVAKGRYRVLLPDGRVQNVNYVAGPDGYHASVTYQSIH